MKDHSVYRQRLAKPVDQSLVTEWLDGRHAGARESFRKVRVPNLDHAVDRRFRRLAHTRRRVGVVEGENLTVVLDSKRVRAVEATLPGSFSDQVGCDFGGHEDVTRGAAR